MFPPYFIILLSILYGSSGQETAGELKPNGTKLPEIVNATSESPTQTETLPGKCENGTEWLCADQGCIDIDKKCDGVFDCKDASDEALKTCRNGNPRPLFGLILHCSLFWTSQHESVCPEICQRSPEFCYYALMAENQEKDTCLLPNYPDNGTYIIIPSNQTDIGAQTDRVDFWLNYTCEEPYVLVQKELLSCTKGKWNNDPNENENAGYCSEACELNKNRNFTYTCPMNLYGKTDCGNHVAVNTSVIVSRATEDKYRLAKNVSVDIFCSEEKEFHIYTDCVQEVDRMQQDNEEPTTKKLTDYETKFNQFKSNENNTELQALVNEYHTFETEVKRNFTLMNTLAEKCDIYLDLLLYNLQQKQEKNIEI